MLAGLCLQCRRCWGAGGQREHTKPFSRCCSLPQPSLPGLQEAGQGLLAIKGCFFNKKDFFFNKKIFFFKKRIFFSLLEADLVEQGAELSVLQTKVEEERRGERGQLK